MYVQIDLHVLLMNNVERRVLRIERTTVLCILVVHVETSSCSVINGTAVLCKIIIHFFGRVKNYAL